MAHFKSSLGGFSTPENRYFFAIPGLRALALMLGIGASLLISVGAGALEDLKVPELWGRVVDTAGLMPSEAKAQLEAKLEALERETGSQVVVLTIPSLEGEPIEDFSLRVAESWKIGRSELDDGLVIVVAKNDRRIRLEVGYGLEGAIPDLIARRILDEHMTPHFRQGDFAGGIDAAVDAVAARIRGENLPTPRLKGGDSGTGDDAGGMVFMFFAFFVMPFAWHTVLAKGTKAWVSYFLLAPFFWLLPTLLVEKLGWVVGGIWLLGFPVLRLLIPEHRRQALRQRSGRGSGGVYWGGGSSGGGFSGGGFSGGGGSFGGGGASGSW